MYISVKSLSRYLLKIIANIKLHPLSNVHDCVAKIFAHRLHARYIIQILVRIYQFMYCIKIEFLILFCVILFSYLSYGKLKKISVFRIMDEIQIKIQINWKKRIEGFFFLLPDSLDCISIKNRRSSNTKHIDSICRYSRH